LWVPIGDDTSPLEATQSWHMKVLLTSRKCLTLPYMKTASVTIRIDADLERELDRLARRSGRSRSDLVRDALRRQIALAQFEEARRDLLPLAESQGLVTDEDVFAAVS